MSKDTFDNVVQRVEAKRKELAASPTIQSIRAEQHKAQLVKQQQQQQRKENILKGIQLFGSPDIAHTSNIPSELREAQPEYTLGDKFNDAKQTTLKTINDIAGTGLGLADLVTTGYANIYGAVTGNPTDYNMRLVSDYVKELTGYDSKEFGEFIYDDYSERYKYNDRQINASANTDNFFTDAWNVAKTYTKNPTNLINDSANMLGNMVAGGALGRAIASGTRVTGLTAAGLGQGSYIFAQDVNEKSHDGLTIGEALGAGAKGLMAYGSTRYFTDPTGHSVNAIGFNPSNANKLATVKNVGRDITTEQVEELVGNEIDNLNEGNAFGTNAGLVSGRTLALTGAVNTPMLLKTGSNTQSSQKQPTQEELAKHAEIQQTLDELKQAKQQETEPQQPVQETKPVLARQAIIGNVQGKITSNFGYRKSPKAGASNHHNGIDIAVPIGTPIYAIADGVVDGEYTNKGGHQMWLTTKDGTRFGFAHLNKASQFIGKEVKKGDIIGYSGNTGVSTGPHIHFTVTKNGKKIDPSNFMYRDSKPNQATSSVPTKYQSNRQAVKSEYLGGTKVKLTFSDGSVELRDGHAGWRNNNAGNLTYTPLTIKYGAIGYTEGIEGTRLAVFPNKEAGVKAHKALLKTPTYQSLTVKELAYKYLGVPKGQHVNKTNDSAISYTNHLLNKTGLSADRKLSSLSNQEFDSLVSAMHQVEGNKVGKTTVLNKGSAYVPEGEESIVAVENSSTTNNRALDLLKAMMNDKQDTDSTETAESNTQEQQQDVQKKEVLQNIFKHFSTVSISALEKNPILDENQKSVLRKMVSAKRALAEANSSNDVAKEILYGRITEDSELAMRGLNQYQEELTKAMEEGDYASLTRLQMQLDNFVFNHNNKFELMQEVMQEADFSKGSVYIAPNEDGYWSVVDTPTTAQEIQAFKESGGVFLDRRSKGLVKRIGKEVDLLNTFYDAWGDMDNVDTESSSLVSQENVSSKPIKETTTQVKPKQETIQANTSVDKAITDSMSMSALRGRVDNKNQYYSMRNALEEGIDGIGKAGWLANYYSIDEYGEDGALANYLVRLEDFNDHDNKDIRDKFADELLKIKQSGEVFKPYKYKGKPQRVAETNAMNELIQGLPTDKEKVRDYIRAFVDEKAGRETTENKNDTQKESVVDDSSDIELPIGLDKKTKADTSKDKSDDIALPKELETKSKAKESDNDIGDIELPTDLETKVNTTKSTDGDLADIELPKQLTKQDKKESETTQESSKDLDLPTELNKGKDKEVSTDEQADIQEDSELDEFTEGMLSILQGVTNEVREAELKKDFFKRNHLIASFKQKSTSVFAQYKDLFPRLRNAKDLAKALSALNDKAPNKAELNQVKMLLRLEEFFSEQLKESFAKKANANYFYEDLKQYLGDTAQDIDRNVLSAISVAVFSWLALNGSKTHKTFKEVREGLGLESDIVEVNLETLKKLSVAGNSRNTVTDAIGRQAVRLLGLKVASKDVNKDMQARLEASLGIWAVTTMLNVGYLYETKIPTKDIYSTNGRDNVDAHFVSPARDGEFETINQDVSAVVKSNKGAGTYLTKLFKDVVGIHHPTLEPKQEIDSEIQGSSAKVTKEHKKYLQQIQQEPIVVQPDMLKAIKRLQELDEVGLAMALGTGITTEDVELTHVSQRDSVISSAENKKRELSLALEYLESITDEQGNVPEFYVDWVVAKNSRSHIKQHSFNPQASKIHRAMGEYKNFATKYSLKGVSIDNDGKFVITDEALLDDTGKATGIGQFIRALGEMLEGSEYFVQSYLQGQNTKLTRGFTVDKVGSKEFLPALMAWINQYPKTIDSMIDIIEGKELRHGKKGLKGIENFVKQGKMEAGSLRALVELARLKQAVLSGENTFNSSIPLGSDGVNNGVAIAKILMGVLQDWRRGAEVGVIFKDVNEFKDFFGIRETDIPDFYEGFKKHLNSTKGDVILKIKSDLGGDGLPAKKIKETLNRYQKSLSLLESLQPTINKRAFAKVLLIPFGYGAGIKRLSRLAEDDFVEGILNHITKLAVDFKKAKDDNERRAIIESYNMYSQNITHFIGANVNYNVFGDINNVLELNLDPNLEKVLRNTYSELMQIWIPLAMQQYESDFANARNANVNMQGIASTAFISMRNYLIDKANTERIAEYVTKLTKQFPKKTTEEIKQIALQRHTAIGFTTKEWEDLIEKPMAKFTPKVNNSFSELSTEENDYTGAYKLITEDKRLINDGTVRSVVNLNGKLYNPNPAIRQNIIEHIGLFGNSAQVQSGDGFITMKASTANNRVALNIHDQNSGAVDNFTQMVQTQNKAFFDFVSSYHANIISAKALVRTLNGRDLLSNTLSEKDLKELNNKLESDVANYISGVDKESFEDVNNDIEEYLLEAISSAYQRDVAKLQSLEMWGTVHQYAGENGEYTLTDKDYEHIQKQYELLESEYKKLLRDVGVEYTGFLNTEHKATEASNTSIHLGGSQGTDTLMGLLAKEYSVKQNHFRPSDSKGNLNKQLLKAGVKATRLESTQEEKAFDELHKLLDKDFRDEKGAKFYARNYVQIKSSNAVYIVGNLSKDSRRVTGFHGTTFDMAVALNKPIYVLDVETETWFGFNGRRFTKVDNPRLANKSAIFGTNHVENIKVKSEDGLVDNPKYLGDEKVSALQNQMKMLFEYSFNVDDYIDISEAVEQNHEEVPQYILDEMEFAQERRDKRGKTTLDDYIDNVINTLSDKDKPMNSYTLNSLNMVRDGLKEINKDVKLSLLPLDNANGMYDSLENTISVSAKLSTKNQLETITHELWHAYTQTSIDNIDSAPPSVKQAYNYLLSIIPNIQNTGKRNLDEAIAIIKEKGVSELVAYAMSNKSVMEHVSKVNPNTEYSPTQSTLLKRFKSAITNLFRTKKERANVERFMEAVVALNMHYQKPTTAKNTTHYSKVNVDEMSLTETLLNLDKGTLSDIENNRLDSVITHLLQPLLDLYKDNKEVNQKINDVIQSPASVGFKMSDKESYVYEALYIVLGEAMNNQSGYRATTTIQKLYQELDNEYPKVIDMFPHINSVHKDERNHLVSMFNFIKGQDKDTVDYARFIALSLASTEFREILNSPRKRTKKEVVSWFDRIMELVSNVLNAFVDTKLLGNTKKESLDRLAQRLVKLELNAKNNLDHKVELAYQKINAPFRKLDGYAQSSIFKGFEYLASKESSSKLFNTLFNIAGLVVDIDNINKLKGSKGGEEFLEKLIGEGVVKGNKLVPETVSVIQEGLQVGTMRKVLDGLIRITQKIAQERQRTKVATTEELLALFKDNGTHLTEANKKSITSVGLRTDVSSLLNYMDKSDVIKLITNAKYRQQQIAELEATLAKQKDGNDILMQAKALAYYMVDEVAIEHLVKSPEAIAMRVGLASQIEYHQIDKNLVNQINTYVSLIALEYTSLSDMKDFISLLETEPKAIQGVLEFHKRLVNDSREEFKHNPLSLAKGYLPQLTNNHRSVQWAIDDDEANEMVKKGWEVISDKLTQDKSDKTPSRKLLFHRDMLYRDYVSGAMDLIDTDSKGTTIASTHDNWEEVHRITKEKAIRRRERAKQSYKTFDPRKQDTSAISVFNADGSIAGYRYEMTGFVRNKYLERDNNFVNVLATYHGNQQYKVDIVPQQKKVMLALFEDYEEGYAKNPKAFIELSHESNDKEIQRIYDMLPHEVKEYAKSLYGKQPIMVRASAINSAFGYRAYSLADMFDKAVGERNVLERIIVAVSTLMFKDKAQYRVLQAERAVQYLTTVTKDFIVIRNPKVLIGNIIANSLLLLLSGVNPLKLIKSTDFARKNGFEYAQLSQELARVETEIKIKGETNELKNKRKHLKARLQKNPLTRFMEAGLMSTIVEDAITTQQKPDNLTSLEEKVKKYTDKIPKGAVTAFDYLSMNQNTEPHKFMASATQFSDFAAKVALIQHLESTGVSFEDAVMEAQDSFINFDVPTSKGLDYMNRVGLFMFTKFILRFQKRLAKLLTTKLASVIAQNIAVDALGEFANVTQPLFVNNLGNPFHIPVYTGIQASDDIATAQLVGSIF